MSASVVDTPAHRPHVGHDFGAASIQEQSRFRFAQHLDLRRLMETGRRLVQPPSQTEDAMAFVAAQLGVQVDRGDLPRVLVHPTQPLERTAQPDAQVVDRNIVALGVHRRLQSARRKRIARPASKTSWQCKPGPPGNQDRAALLPRRFAAQS
jgi:hypothetical protein